MSYHDRLVRRMLVYGAVGVGDHIADAGKMVNEAGRLPHRLSRLERWGSRCVSD